MTIATATAFRRNLYNFLERAVRYNEPVTVTTKHGNAVILSEDEYKNIAETLFLSSIPSMRKELLEAKDIPLEECVTGDKLDW